MQKQINLIVKASIFAALLTAPLLFNVDSAQAKLKICNETNETRDVAIGYKTGEGWVSEGWWGIIKGDCTTVIKDDLTSRFYYYRAKHRGGDFDGERYNFCTDSKAFTIIGDKDCKKRGYKVEDFRQLKLAKGTTGFTLTLDNTTIYSASKEVAKNTEPGTTPEPEVKTSPEPAAQNVGPGAPSGTHGEPYSIRAVLKGCDRVDGLLWCTFMADGWSYVVKDDGKSHSHILQEIDALPLNGTYDLSGDMIFYSGKSADITIREYAPAQSSSNTKSNSAAPGTYGETYDEIAIFKGCDRIDGLLSCNFEANGGRYIIFDDGKTNETLLNQVDGLSINSRYRILGDVHNYGDITFEVTLREYQDMGDNADQLRMNRLVGLWRSMDDPSSTIRFFDDYKKFDYYNGDLSSEGAVSFTTTCNDSSVRETGTSFLQIQDGPEDYYCYEVIENTEDKLVLMYLPRGNFLEYEKDLGLN
ncbi:DUF1036 domain-containing protein [Lentilitoribacter sp. Alg239-R112]|uniref:DUF1036 domain-containing protein n=1 Tax=Lentilitoribacter sp. Alg239-R112 TaxID=2305987 RepID=UPI0013A6C453|nr:DUF1036 domain-containing protein [Lentilitoribacter sp. Alg239-R112]